MAITFFARRVLLRPSRSLKKAVQADDSGIERALKRTAVTINFAEKATISKAEWDARQGLRIASIGCPIAGPNRSQRISLNAPGDGKGMARDRAYRAGVLKRGFAMTYTVKITMMIYLVSIALVANGFEGNCAPELKWSRHAVRRAACRDNPAARDRRRGSRSTRPRRLLEDAAEDAADERKDELNPLAIDVVALFVEQHDRLFELQRRDSPGRRLPP